MHDVRRLWLLRELAEHGTIAATARACSLTPSAVSQQLSVLQREVGATLFVRDGRGIVLTEAARVLVAHAENVLAELERAKSGISELGDSARGVIRLGAFPTAAASLVPPAIADARTDHPDLKVLLEEWETVEGIPALKSGRVDLLLVYEYNLLPEISDPGIELVPLFTEPLFAAAPASTRWPDSGVALESLREEPWIAPRSDSALRSVLDRACGLAGFSPVWDYTSDDYTVILALVGAGLGVSLVPRLASANLTAVSRLLPITEPTLSRRVSIAARAGSTTHPACALIIDNIREVVAGSGLASND